MGSSDVPLHHAEATGAQASDTALHWELCASRLAGRYRVCVDRGGRSGRLRYVAVARTLSIRPYAMVTSDPAELLQALGCADIPAMPPAGPGSVR